MKQNFQLMLDKTIESIAYTESKPRLLLHACCAPCSSYVLEYLSNIFDITLLFFNPNISPSAEYEMRKAELYKLVADMELNDVVHFENVDYQPELFLEIAKGLELAPEGGERCKKCYELRLRETAKRARDGGYDYFTTTLSISPYKNAEWLCEIGGYLSEEFEVNIGELMDMPLRRDTSELSDEELHLLKLYRRSRSMPEPMRNALRETLETTINLYLNSYNDVKTAAKRRDPKKKEG